jgi:hypothetical protein
MIDKYKFPPVCYPRYFNSRDGRELSYLEIPKSGCSSIKAHLSAEPLPNTLPEREFDTVFTVIRNPWHRYISGWGQLVRGGLFSGTPEELLEKINTEGFFDRHIAPQSYFIEAHLQIYNTLIIFDFDQYFKGVDYHHNKGNITPGALFKYRHLMPQVEELFRDDYKYFIK